MDEYFIGAGALLIAGSEATLTPATLHAQTGSRLAGQIVAAVIDFEAARSSDVSRLLIVAAGWAAAQFRSEVALPLLARGECSLADVIAMLARATGAPEVDFFARWVPDDTTVADLEERGIRLRAHPLEAIGQAALVSGQRLERWCAPFRAA